MGKAERRTFPATPMRVWEALHSAAETEFWEIRTEDPSTGRMLLNTGGSMWSWQGQDLAIELTEKPDGCEVLVVGTISRAADDDNPDLKLADDLNRALSGVDTAAGPGVQLFSWGEKGRVVKKLYAGLEKQLGSTGTPT